MNTWEEQDYTKRFDVRVWRHLLTYAKPYRRHFLWISATMILCAGIDVLFPLFAREAIDRFVEGRTTVGLAGFAVRYFLAVAVQALTVFVFCSLSSRVELGMTTLIRRLGFRRLQELPFSFYDRTPVGYLIARMTTDAQRLGDTVGWGLIDLMWAGGFLMLTSVSMLLLNWRLALIVLSAIPVIAALAMYFQKRILKSYREMRKLNSRITSAFNEGIMGARTTKTLRREAENEREFESLTHSMKRSAVRAAVLSALFLPLVISLAALVMCYVLDLGGADVLKNGLTIGTLAAFISYATQIFEPINSIARLFADLQSSQAAAERVMSMLETEPEISDAPEVVELFGDSFHPKRENWPDIRGDIAFEGVGFRYSEGGEVLSNFDLTVRAGETIALVGETGAGKSTIVNLLCRFYEPTEGRILIDGSDYRTRSMLWLQSHLGYVLQQPHLFSGTVRENIRYGKLDATDEEVETAARLVDAEEFILKLEKGYDTDVGEGGDRLSIGQKQLVSFARALIADPKIFVLDEATSSVDTETEQRIQRAIRESLRGRTSFIIAHRLSTIRTADRILVVRGGRITEVGTHRELLKLKGYYYDLYVNQFQDEMEKSVLGKA